MGKLIIGIYTNLYHRIAGASYGSDHWDQNSAIAPNRDDYSQHVEFNHVHHYGLDILSDFGGIIYKVFLGCVIHFCLWVFVLGARAKAQRQNTVENC